MDDGFAVPVARTGAEPISMTTTNHANATSPAPRLPALSTSRDGAPQTDWSVIPDNAHFVQFYEADAYLLDAVGAYIGEALRFGEAGIVIATKLHRDGIRQRLQHAGIDVDAAIASGQFVNHDAFETLTRFMDGSTPDPDRFDEVVGEIVRTAVRSHDRVRVFGGMVALLAADGNYEATLRLEEFWNDFQRQLPFTLFCAYPMDHDGGEA